MTAELVPYQEKSAIELAGEAWPLAQRIAQTPFAPKGLGGKPEAVLACMLVGHELRIGVMQALNKIHVVDGRPALAAELMRALILREGHELWVEELSNTRCTIVAQRRGSDRQQRFTWTTDDAKTAGLLGKDNWRKYPRAMLLARATGEACRTVFPDLLAGMSYTSEELTDGEGVDLEDLQAAAAAPPAPTPAKRTAKAKRAATRPAERPAADASSAQSSSVPPLPGEADPDDISDAELVPDYEGPDTSHDARPLPARSAIVLRCTQLGISDRDERLRLMAAIVGRPVATSKDLSDEELATVIRRINEEGYQPEHDLAAEPVREDILEFRAAWAKLDDPQRAQLAAWMREQGITNKPPPAPAQVAALMTEIGRRNEVGW